MDAVPAQYQPQLERFGLDRDLASPAVLMRFGKGEYLCHEGDPFEWMYYVVKGRIKVSVAGANGRTLLICFYQDEGIIGSIETLEGLPATASAQAVGEVDCIAVPIAPNRERFRQNTQFLYYLSLVLAQMFGRSSKNSAINILYPLETRLCSYILLTAEGGLFRENLSETADLLGTSYRHLLRTLESLCQSGVLRKQAKGYAIADQAALRDTAQDYYAL